VPCWCSWYNCNTICFGKYSLCWRNMQSCRDLPSDEFQSLIIPSDLGMQPSACFDIFCVTIPVREGSEWTIEVVSKIVDALVTNVASNPTLSAEKGIHEVIRRFVDFQFQRIVLIWAISLFIFWPFDSYLSIERTLRNTEGKGIDQRPFDEAQSDLGDRQITSFRSFNEMSQARTNGRRADGDQPNIEDGNCQGRPRQAQEKVQCY